MSDTTPESTSSAHDEHTLPEPRPASTSIAPEPPLTLLYNWRVRATWLSVAISIVVVYALFTKSGGGIFLLLFALIMGSMMAVNVWLQTRAYFEVLGTTAKVRRFGGMRIIDGPKVVMVKEVINGRSPDVLLITSDGKRYVVPSSRLEKGHSTLFDWLAQVAPNAEYDKGAQKILNLLGRERGEL